MNSLNNKFDNLSHQVNEHKSENQMLKEQNAKLENTVTTLSEKLSTVETALSDQARKHEKLESFSRKSNLKFYGIEGEHDETTDISESKVRDFIGKTFGVDCTDMPIERAHRIPSRSGTRPILVQFSHYRHRDTVLKAFRQKRRETDMTIHVGEDLPERVSKAWTGLY